MPGGKCFKPPDDAWQDDREVVPSPRLSFLPDDIEDVLADMTDDERALLRRVG